MRTKQQVRVAARAACVEQLEGRTLMAGDAVLEWNNVAVEAGKAERLPPPRQVRMLAMMHAAVFDAVNGIEQGYDPYLVNRRAPRWASADAAAAAAARDVLAALMPARAATFDAALTTSLAGVPNGRAEDTGVAFGRLIAEQVLAARQDDGVDDVVVYVPGTEADDWQPTSTAPAAQALMPQFATVDPFGIPAPDHFRPAAPPSIESVEFTAAFNEVKALGAKDGSTRTDEQTEIALYWAGPGGTVQPPGHWNRIARGVAADQENTLAENARLFALLNIGMADAVIASWDAKFEYEYVRPLTAIHNAENDGNPDTAADAGWSSLLGTPPFPAYTSGHSTVSGAAAAILADFFGNDDIAFTDTSEGLPGGPPITRSFDSFSEAAEEAGVSRIYGGIHWSFDNTAGLAAGRDVGGFIADNLLQPRVVLPREAPDAPVPFASTARSLSLAIAADGEDDGEDLLTSLTGA